jgi:hypothetical protein
MGADTLRYTIATRVGWSIACSVVTGLFHRMDGRVGFDPVYFPSLPPFIGK